MVIEEGFIHFTLVVLWVVEKKPNRLVGSVKVTMVYGFARGFRGWKFRRGGRLRRIRRLCFRCLGSFHQGRACPRSRPCNINGCAKNHHNLLHDTKMDGKQPEGKAVEPKEFNKQLTFPGEGKLVHVLILHPARKRDQTCFR